jgi:YesN/AraC family two-component response regulator
VPKILIIDDDVIVRNTIARILSRADYDLVVAPNGRQGLALFEKEYPELVITDLIMPEKEGVEMIREIREIRPNAKIIAISGGGRLGNTDYLLIAAKLGTCEIIAKPFEPSDLTEAVSRCLATPVRE